jgi:hypothetical protein
MENVQKHNICANVPSSETFRSYSIWNTLICISLFPFLCELTTKLKKTPLVNPYAILWSTPSPILLTNGEPAQQAHVPTTESLHFYARRSPSFHWLLYYNKL